jgi:hypothetical protein
MGVQVPPRTPRSGNLLTSPTQSQPLRARPRRSWPSRVRQPFPPSCRRPPRTPVQLVKPASKRTASATSEAPDTPRVRAGGPGAQHRQAGSSLAVADNIDMPVPTDPQQARPAQAGLASSPSSIRIVLISSTLPASAKHSATAASRVRASAAARGLGDIQDSPDQPYDRAVFVDQCLPAASRCRTVPSGHKAGRTSPLNGWTPHSAAHCSAQTSSPVTRFQSQCRPATSAGWTDVGVRPHLGASSSPNAAGPARPRATPACAMGGMARSS